MSAPSSSTPRHRPNPGSSDITIITTTRHINSQPPTPTLTTPVTSPTPSTNLPRTLSARSLPQPHSPTAPATAAAPSGWWNAVASTVKFLSSLAVEDESPAAPVTPKGLQATRTRKLSPPAVSPLSATVTGNPLAATAPSLREAAALSRGRSGTALPGLPRPVHMQSHTQLPGMAVPLTVSSRSISMPNTPQQSTTSLASTLTPPMSPTAAPPLSSTLHLSTLQEVPTHQPSSHSRVVSSALSHPSPSKRSLLDESHQADSLSTSPALPVSGHRRSASHSHMSAPIPPMHKNGVKLEVYKPVEVDDSADAIEAEVPHKPLQSKAASGLTNASTHSSSDAISIATAPAAPSTLTIAPATPPHLSQATDSDTKPPTLLSPSFASSTPSSVSPKSTTTDHPRNVRLLHFQRLLNEDTLDLTALRSLAWNGIPAECRADVWRLLLGYLPLSRERRDSMLDKRRQEYMTFLRQHYLTLAPSTPSQHHTASLDSDTLNQIQQDVPRTSPAYHFFKRPAIQKSLERVLFIFAIRHPASGYVQGMNDLITPFYCVMLDAAIAGGADMVLTGDKTDDAAVSEAVMLAVEADCYWCLSSFLDAVQDHYTFAQPGIQRCVYRLSSLVHSLSPALYAHLEREQVSFMHFAFRWMNCLLMREMSLPCTVRLFDTYIASLQPQQSTVSGGSVGLASFASFHVYVCTAFLLQWSAKLLSLDFQELILFLQRPPTERWVVRDVEGLIAQAYVYQCKEEAGSGGVDGSTVHFDGGGKGLNGFS